MYLNSRLITEDEQRELAEKYPIMSQDGKGREQIFQYKFFLGSACWFVLEGEDQEKDFNFFGVVMMDEKPEYRYFKLSDLENLELKQKLKGSDGKPLTLKIQISRDYSFRPSKFGEIQELRKWYNYLFNEGE